MLTIVHLTPGDHMYEQVWKFAHRAYIDRLSARVLHRPPHFIAAMAGGEVIGCLGLNDRVESSLFTADLRFQRLQQSWANGCHAIDQSFFTVTRHRIAVPVLIAVAAAYAETIGVHKIAYAGIAVSCRTIDRLGLSVRVLGPANLNLVSPTMRTVMATWHHEYDPVSCVLDTHGAREIALGILDRHKCRVQLSAALDGAIFQAARSSA